MTDTLHPGRTTPDRPLSGQPDARRGRLRRWARSIAYDALLVPVGVRTMADAVLGEATTAVRRWRRLGRLLDRDDSVAVGESPVGAGRVFGYGLMSSVLGLISWFLLMLAVTAVVRGPFYGFVEHGPFRPGTWGGPTKAGAWAVHAAVAVPAIVVFLLALRGIAWLQAELVGRLDGTTTRRWVLPATIALAAGGLLFFWSWLQQL
jgi:hypothetical protein